MEVARLKPFLDSRILFLLSKEDYMVYEQKLLHELWLCHTTMNYSEEELNNMPTYKRIAYVKDHNKQVQKEKSELERRK